MHTGSSLVCTRESPGPSDVSVYAAVCPRGSPCAWATYTQPTSGMHLCPCLLCKPICAGGAAAVESKPQGSILNFTLCNFTTNTAPVGVPCIHYPSWSVCRIKSMYCTCNGAVTYTTPDVTIIMICALLKRTHVCTWLGVHSRRLAQLTHMGELCISGYHLPCMSLTAATSFATRLRCVSSGAYLFTLLACINAHTVRAPRPGPCT